MTTQTQGPRSLPQILGGMVATFLSKQGVPKLKVGNPLLSLMEAASQADFRNSQDNFAILADQDLERATGVGLDAIGTKERVPRPGATFARGSVTVGDSAFVPVRTKVYQGLGAPNVGTTVLAVADGSGFTAAGTHNLYIGRGTINLEGPIAFNGASVVQVGAYWQITLATATQRFHNVGETVTLGQGGNRAIPAGTTVQTPQANAATAVAFTTLYADTLPDGENQLQGVQVVATLPGLTGNVAALAINSFQTPSWSTATVSNPAPFSNATARADDRTYRDLIRQARATRAQGIDGAITFAVLNKTAPDENRTITSSSLVSTSQGPATLYVDDGTGYEEHQLGVAIEVVDAQALGGETDFQLAAARPITKANLQTSLTAPFALSPGDALAIDVGGVVTTHIFEAAEARSLGVATAFEIVTAINGDPNLDWQARAINAGTGVAFEARADTNEILQVVSPGPALVDANTFLGLPTGVAQTLRLYRNDVLLSKDGQDAIVFSQPQGQWAALTSGETLQIGIDGTPTQTFTFVDADFVAAHTGFATLSGANSLQAWAQVFNAKIAGQTTQAEGNRLGLTSNAGPTASARLTIVGGTLVTKGVFVLQDVRGAARDYELNRNTAQVHLETALVAGDALTAGSVQTRAFVQTPALGTVTLASDAHLWWVVDGGAQVIPTGITTATVLTYALVAPAPAWGQRVRISAPTPIWSQVEVLDWIIFWDQNLAAPCQGTWRVDAVDPLGFYVDIAREPTFATTGNQTPSQAGGIVVVRTPGFIHEVTVPAGSNYTATTLAPLVAPPGATGTTQATTAVRVRTNTWVGGDLALVAADVSAQTLRFPTGSAQVDQPAQVASVLARPQRTTPDFMAYQVATVTSTTVVTATGVPQVALGQVAAGARDYPDADAPTLFLTHTGSQPGWESALQAESGATLTFRTPVEASWLVQDRFYFAHAYDFGYQDGLNMVLDQDVDEKRFGINVFRRASTVGAYGTTITLRDADAAGATLSSTFGTSFDWRDFVVLMRARGKTHPGDTSRTGLWRYYRHGPGGTAARIQYRYATAPGLTTGVATTAAGDANTDIVIALPSGTARTGIGTHNTTQVGLYMTGPNAQGLFELTYAVAIAIQAAIRDGSNDTTLTLINGANIGGLPSTITDHGIQVGAQVWVQSGDVNFSTGLKVVTGRTSTTITYTEVAAAAGPDTFIGTVSLDISGQATLVGSTVALGDVVTVAPAAFVTPVAPLVGAPLNPLPFQRTAAINTLGNSGTISGTTGSQFWTVATDQTPSVTLLTSGVVNAGFTLGQTVVGQTSGAQGLVAAAPAPNTLTLVDTTGAFQAGEVLVFNGTVNGHVSGSTPFQFLPGQPGASVAADLIWYPINATTNVSIYPVNTGSNTIAQIVTAVNALAASNASVPITGVAVGDGAGHTNGQISWATYEDPAVSGATTLGNAVPPWYPLFDGINWVQSTNTPANAGVDYQFGLKAGVTAQLGSNSDWANEDVRLVPLTAANVVDWLDAPAVAGLFANAEVTLGGHADQPQVATLVTGSLGAVQVQSGPANALVTNVLGSTTPVVGTYGISQVRASDAPALLGQHWVAVQNQVRMPRQVITASTALTLLEPSGEATLNVSGTPWWTWSGNVTAPTTGFTWQFERWGNFMAIVWAATEASAPNVGRVQEGDWVQVGPPAPAGLAVVQVVIAGGVATVYTAFPHNFQAGNVVVASLNAPGLVGTTGPVLATGTTAIAGVTYSWVQYADTLSTDGTYGAPGNPIGTLTWATPCNAANAGLFRIVRIQFNAGAQGYASQNQVIIWVENPNGVEEVSNADLYLLGFDSALPGDGLNVATPLWGVANEGLWTIAASGSALTQIAGAGLTRAGSTVTATTATPHGLLTGQRFTLSAPGGNTDPAFPGGDKVVATVGGPTSLTYTEAQPTGTAATTSGPTIRTLTGYPWQNQFQTRVGTVARVPVQTGPVAALGAAAPLIQVIEGQPSRLIKRVYSVSPNQVDPTQADVKWDTLQGYRLVGAAAGSQVVALDKLGFPTGLVQGSDAYAHTTGIIAEANRIIYGDPAAPAQYPGVAADQARIDIRASFIRRAQVSLAIRLVSQIGAQDIIEAVRSAVAAIINAAGVGQSVALGALVAAAESVQGVESAVMVSPAMSATDDLLVAAGFERLQVLDAVQDVLVSLIG